MAPGAIDNGYVRPNGGAGMGRAGQTYWAVFRPVLEERRKTEPGLWKAWERWIADLDDRDRKAGTVRDLSPLYWLAGSQRRSRTTSR